jgi:hypothetical protein
MLVVSDRLPDFPLFDVDDAEMIMGAEPSRYYGSASWQGGKMDAHSLSRQLRAECEVFSSLFFQGGKLSDFGREVKPDLDPKAVMRALRSLMGSWSVSHEQKEATVALAIHHWTQPIEQVSA